MMKFKPADKAGDDANRRCRRPVPDDLDPDKLMRPAASRDSKFFWDGVDAHELRIQKRPTARCSTRRCRRSGRTRPCRRSTWCPRAEARCTNFVVHHAPKVPGHPCRSSSRWSNWKRESDARRAARRRPRPSTSECRSAQRISTCRSRPPVRTWTLYAWGPSRERSLQWAPSCPSCRCTAIPFIVSTAIATRDYRTCTTTGTGAGQGPKDIFVNILTDTGLVQRYVTGLGRTERGHQSRSGCGSGALVRLRHGDVLRWVTAVDGLIW